VRRRQRAWAYVKALYWKAYEDNLTGLAGMVAYNLLLSLFPLALIALFIAGSVLQSSDLESQVLADLKRLFPSATEHTIDATLTHVRQNATSFGIVALISSIWFGSSFWGALDTAFCQIYHVECRKWVAQKRFSLIMLVVILLLMAATLLVPTAQSILTQGAQRLPFGLADLSGVIYALTLVAGLTILFLILALIYSAVPNRFVPWRAVWPGAVAATVAMGIVDYVFPAYLSASPLQTFGGTLVFIVILLLWFYALAIIILGGAEINAARFEVHDTGELGGEPAPP
jgi:YihY family inner membrane protein